MLPASALKDILSQEISDRDRVLICLAVGPVAPRPIREVKALALSAGWRRVKNKNLSSILSRSRGLSVRTDDGWELTAAGKQHVATLAGPLMKSPIAAVASSLRSHLRKLHDAEARSFVEEAIQCFESRQYRAAVVLSWVGAVSLLHNHVVSCHLARFNAETAKRNNKWKAAKNADDIGLMREDTFLDVLQSISVIGKNVKQELKKCLILRNGCGHPNSLKVAEHKVSAHIEDLILNVFTAYQ